jgi:hypothetical protein
MILLAALTTVLSVTRCQAGGPGELEAGARVSAAFRAAGLGENGAYRILEELLRRSGHRLSGSAGADSAVAVTAELLHRVGADSVWKEPVLVPRWVRGSTEEAILLSKRHLPLSVCALGGSVGTPPGGITAGVVEVRSFEGLRSLGQRARGKIVFFNRPMDPSKVNTFEAYGGAVDQRSVGAVAAAREGALAVLVRSVTTALDDVPHTGAMGYADSVMKIPAAAISTVGANTLSRELKADPGLRLRLRLSCATLPDVLSANVMGEIRGTERPEEIIVIGGHLDSWDKGTGAHDDGAGCAQSIEVLRLFRALQLKPRRTIRAVMFMNEENGTRGGQAYALDPGRDGERHVALIESDRGGFAPRGFTVDGDSALLGRVRRWQPLFEELNAGSIQRGYGGVDISFMAKNGVPAFGLLVEMQRYFDYHHSANDTLGAVHPRELELGAIAGALLCYLISEYGL